MRRFPACKSSTKSGSTRFARCRSDRRSGCSSSPIARDIPAQPLVTPRRGGTVAINIENAYEISQGLKALDILCDFARRGHPLLAPLLQSRFGNRRRHRGHPRDPIHRGLAGLHGHVNRRLPEDDDCQVATTESLEWTTLVFLRLLPRRDAASRPPRFWFPALRASLRWAIVEPGSRFYARPSTRAGSTWAASSTTTADLPTPAIVKSSQHLSRPR